MPVKRGQNVKKRIIFAAAAGLFVPYVGTMAWTGNIGGIGGVPVVKEQSLQLLQPLQEKQGKIILLDRGEKTYRMELEEYLPGVIARQIPAEYEPEALKAQAIIARTYIRGQMMSAGESDEIAESALDLDFLGEDELRALWGTGRFAERYTRLEQAVRETKGQIMMYGNEPIDPLFCRSTAGKTRTGDIAHPYLKSTACQKDTVGENFLKTVYFSPEKMAAAVNTIDSGAESPRTVQPEALLNTMQIGSRDEAGYVNQMELCGLRFTGDELSAALQLASSCFFIETEKGKIKITTKGEGHGYGLSQNTANVLAAEGWTAGEILEHFYKNITFLSE